MSVLIDSAEVMKLLDEQCWNGMFTLFRGEHHVNCFRELVKAIPPAENKGDLISRQAVRLIESDSNAYLEAWNESYKKGFCDAINRVLDLPSAQSENCEGCKNLGKWENEYEYGYSSPCTRCKRKAEDHYER